MRLNIILVTVILLLKAWPGSAQVVAAPKVKVADELLDAVRDLGEQFARALSVDCPEEQCFARGCVYQSHESVVSSEDHEPMPGLGTSINTKPEKAQIFLSRARCEYAFEADIDAKTIKSIDTRLEQKLSKGLLKVAIKSYALPALVKPMAKVTAKDDRLPPPVFANRIADELWSVLKAHFFWMAGIILISLAAVVLLWAFRRLGRDSKLKELRYLKARRELLQGETHDGKPQAGTASGEQETKPEPGPSLSERQAKLLAAFAETPAALHSITQRWLANHEFAKLATAAFVLQGSALPLLDQAAPAHVANKIKFFDYLSTASAPKTEEQAALVEELEEALLRERAFAAGAVANFTRYFQESSPRQIAEAVQDMPDFCAKTCFLLLPEHLVERVSRFLPSETVRELAEAILDDNRVSAAAIAATEKWLVDIMDGQTPRLTDALDLAKRPSGEPMQASFHLATLLRRMPREERRTLIEAIKTRHAGEVPEWGLTVFYPEMLAELSDSESQGLMIDTDPADLALWLKDAADASTRAAILAKAPAALRAQLDQAPSADLDSKKRASKVAAVSLSLGRAMQRRYHKGSARFESLV